MMDRLTGGRRIEFMDMGEVKTKCYHWNDLSCLIKAILGLYFESECT